MVNVGIISIFSHYNVVLGGWAHILSASALDTNDVVFHLGILAGGDVLFYVDGAA